MRFGCNKLARVAGITLLLAAFSITGALAQGFPGGGGKPGGRGGMKPSGSVPRPNPSAEQQPSSPLATFLDGLRALRTELLVREDQTTAWTSMRDALRAYVDLEPQANERSMHSASIAVDPLQRIRNLADDTRARADALTKVGDSVGALITVLDDRQRETFGQRLADAFAARSAPNH
jgi:hypothetical protein